MNNILPVGRFLILILICAACNSRPTTLLKNTSPITASINYSPVTAPTTISPVIATPNLIKEFALPIHGMFLDYDSTKWEPTRIKYNSYFQRNALVSLTVPNCQIEEQSSGTEIIFPEKKLVILNNITFELYADTKQNLKKGEGWYVAREGFNNPFHDYPLVPIFISTLPTDGWEECLGEIHTILGTLHEPRFNPDDLDHFGDFGDCWIIGNEVGVFSAFPGPVAGLLQKGEIIEVIEFGKTVRANYWFKINYTGEIKAGYEASQSSNGNLKTGVGWIVGNPDEMMDCD